MIMLHNEYNNFNKVNLVIDKTDLPNQTVNDFYNFIM